MNDSKPKVLSIQQTSLVCVKRSRHMVSIYVHRSGMIFQPEILMLKWKLIIHADVPEVCAGERSRGA